MSLTTYDQIIDRISDGYSRQDTIKYRQAASVSVFGNALVTNSYLGDLRVVPTLESGVTAYIPTFAAIQGSAAGNLKSIAYMLCKMVDLGNLSLATPTFTDGSSMGTRTELGTTVNVASPVFFEVTTVLNATPGTFTVTYVDQDGNTAETTAAVTPTASAVVESGGFLPLNTGDWGVRDITSATRTGGTTPSGVINFWGVIPLAMGYKNTDVQQINLITDGLSTIKLAAGEKLGIFQLSSTTLTAGSWMGAVNYVGDN